MSSPHYITSTEIAKRIGVQQHVITQKILSGELVPDGQVSRGVGFCPIFDEAKVEELSQAIFGRPPVFTRTPTTLVPEVH